MKHELRRARAQRIRQRTDLNKQYREQAAALSNRALGEKFDIHPGHVSSIVNNHHWLKKSAKNLKINYDDAMLIREAAKERNRLNSLAAEHSHQRIADDEGCSLVMVTQIAMGIKWRELSDA